MWGSVATTDLNPCGSIQNTQPKATQTKGTICPVIEPGWKFWNITSTTTLGRTSSQSSTKMWYQDGELDYSVLFSLVCWPSLPIYVCLPGCFVDTTSKRALERYTQQLVAKSAPWRPAS